MSGALQRAGVAATEAAEAERDAALWQLRSDARAAIARARAAAERLAAARVFAGSIEEVTGVLAAREREGEGSRFDRRRAHQELIEAQQLIGGRVRQPTAQKEPMALVILFGLTSSTILNMVMVPVMYAHFGRPVARQAGRLAGQ